MPLIPMIPTLTRNRLSLKGHRCRSLSRGLTATCCRCLCFRRQTQNLSKSCKTNRTGLTVLSLRVPTARTAPTAPTAPTALTALMTDQDQMADSKIPTAQRTDLAPALMAVVTTRTTIHCTP